MSLNANQNVHVMKVSHKSNVNRTADAIVNLWKEGKTIEIAVVGAGALNQAQKAIIAAQAIVAPMGITIYERSAFGKAIVEGEERTSIKKRLIFQEG